MKTNGLCAVSHVEGMERNMSDLISRQAAIEAIKEDKIDLTNPNVVAVFKTTGDFEKVETQVMTCDRHIKILKDLPSERKHGKWIPVTNGRGGHECSLCHTYAPSFKTGNEWLTDYCGNCGARME